MTILSLKMRPTCLLHQSVLGRLARLPQPRRRHARAESDVFRLVLTPIVPSDSSERTMQFGHDYALLSFVAHHYYHSSVSYLLSIFDINPTCFLPHCDHPQFKLYYFPGYECFYMFNYYCTSRMICAYIV